MKFLFPINGDCLNANDGRVLGDELFVKVKVEAPKGHEVYINDVKADSVDGEYSAEIGFSGYRSTLVAEDKTSGETAKIAVFRLCDPMNKFRVSSDDNILFLQDLTKNKDVYKSIFENPYLAVYKKAHDLYGAKVHLNLFYEFIPTEDFSGHTEYFNLTMMTDKFKDEFIANSDWLKLAFHANSEYPDMPYKNTTYKQMHDDCVKVCREIIRFAGKECMNDTTTIHWGEVNREGVRALRNLGMKSLTGYLTFNEDGTPLVAYYLNNEETAHTDNRDFWYDESEDMMFARIDIVLNLKDYNWVMEEMERIYAHPGRRGFVSMMIHEQYYHSDYKNYLPDFEKRTLDACKFLSDRGYKGTHVADMTEEKPLCESIKMF